MDDSTYAPDGAGKVAPCRGVSRELSGMSRDARTVSCWPSVSMAYFSVAKASRKEGKSLEVMVKHNRRVHSSLGGEELGIDPARTHLNECLWGDPDWRMVIAAFNTAVMVADAPMKANTVFALEFVFSIPAGHRVRGEPIDEMAFFRDCMGWVVSRFASGSWKLVLTADVHRDQSNPHMHLLLLPLAEGRWFGSDAVGHAPKLAAHQDSFHGLVGTKYGLTRPSPKLGKKERAQIAAEVLAAMRSRADPAIGSDMWHLIERSIRADPGVYAEFLGVRIARKIRWRTLGDLAAWSGRGAMP
jgi:hypothetical protein